jgi:citrate synthase
MSDWLTREEALTRLGVRAQTLYAYVSRRRVEARADPVDPRRSLYRAGDIADLATRKARGRKVAQVAAQAMAWGEPVMESEISTVSQGRLYYRGLDAARLAETETLESVARLLRGGGGQALASARRPAPPDLPTARERAFAALAARAASAQGGQAQDEAALLLDILTDAVIGSAGVGAIHARLARAWRLSDRGQDLIRRALVLLADHELNPSTFAARVAASTGASLGACALAGLATLSGARHGGMAERVIALAAAAERETADKALAARPHHWGATPGFGHPLYPEGDPRAQALMSAFAAPPELEAFRRTAAESGQRDNVDFALAALARGLRLPEGASFVLFAIARCAGWTAHALEQARAGGAIRPRARYVGRPPDAAVLSAHARG